MSHCCQANISADKQIGYFCVGQAGKKCHYFKELTVFPVKSWFL